MAFPGGVDKIVISGALPGGEVWACGFYLAPSSTTVTMQSVAQAQKDSAAFVNFAQALQPIMFTGTTLNRIQAYRYLPGQKSASDVGSVSVSYPGTSSSIHPNQTALVLTLRTALATARGRGRLFLPANGAPMAGTGLVVLQNVQNVADAFWFYAGTQTKVVSSVGAGLVSAVTAVTADNRTDVIRARAERMSGITRYTAQR